MNEMLLALVELAKSQSPELWELATQRAMVMIPNTFWIIFVVCMILCIIVFMTTDGRPAGMAAILLMCLMICGAIILSAEQTSTDNLTDAKILIEYIKLLSGL
jgi:glycerol uptake facilitator-like aquaporin